MNINNLHSPAQPLVSKSSTTSILDSNSKANAKDFKQIMQALGGMPTSTSAQSSNGTERPRQSYDFTQMTPQQMREAANDLYTNGTIDFDAMAGLQMIGPLGKAGPNGEFIPFTSAERQQIDNTPINYLSAITDRLSSIERMGRTQDPTSGYDMWSTLSEVLNKSQNSVLTSA